MEKDSTARKNTAKQQRCQQPGLRKGKGTHAMKYGQGAVVWEGNGLSSEQAGWKQMPQQSKASE